MVGVENVFPVPFEVERPHRDIQASASFPLHPGKSQSNKLPGPDIHILPEGGGWKLLSTVRKPGASVQLLKTASKQARPVVSVIKVSHSWQVKAICHQVQAPTERRIK